MDSSEYWDKVAGKKEFTVPFDSGIFRARLPLDSSILDFGCGYGRVLSELSGQGYKNLYGCDFSSRMLELSSQAVPDAILKQNTGCRIPFHDESFDCVIMLAVLTCITDDSDQRKFVSEALRVLKTDGILYVGDFLLNQDERNLERYERCKASHPYGVFKSDDGAFLRHHSEEYINQLFSCACKISFEKTVFKTMNGHESKGFVAILSKISR